MAKGKKIVEENLYYYHEKPIINKKKFIDDGNPVVVELFCGCGGTSCGFEMAGYNIAVGVDIHEPSIETFKKNHPKCSTILGDIRDIKPQEITELLDGHAVDVLIGGVPCQGFSLNNKKRDANDERNYLYLEFLRFVKELKPKTVVIENVSGMKSTKNGEFVKKIEKEISKSGNYKVKSKLLNAADYGVPQKRQRLIFVGVHGKEYFDFDEMKKTNGPGTKNKYITVKDAIGDLPSLDNNEEKTEYRCNPFSSYQKLMRRNSEKLTCHKSPNHPIDTVQKIAETKPGEPMYPKFKQRIRLAWDIQSPTQVSGGIRPQFQFGHPEDNRGLTIRERCRIQSFPDDFIVMGGIVQGRVQTGNAVPPLLAKAVAEALKKYIEKED